MTPLEMMRSTLASESGMASISPYRVSTFSRPASCAAFGCALEHFGQEVESEDLAGGAGALGREDGVDAAAAANVKNGVTGSDVGEPQVIGHTKRPVDSGRRDLRHSSGLYNL